MPIKLTLLIVVGAIGLIIISTFFLRKGRIPEKYALLWYAMAIILSSVASLPEFFAWVAKKLGFYPMSTFIIALFILIILLLIMALTIMMAGQKKKTTMLIQELSILKKELEDIEKED